MAQNGAKKWEPTQFAGKSDDFPAQCVLRSGVEHQISSHFFVPFCTHSSCPLFLCPLQGRRKLPRGLCVGDEGGGLDLPVADRREIVVAGTGGGLDLLIADRREIVVVGMGDGWGRETRVDRRGRKRKFGCF